MDNKKNLNKCTSSPIENNVDDSASGVSSDESVYQNSPEDVDLPTSASQSQHCGDRRQRIQQAYVELGNADVVCGRGFQPDSKNGWGFDKESTPNDAHSNFFAVLLDDVAGFLGNLRMHRLTNVYRAQYSTSSKKVKNYWVHRVIQEIREAGGRFLQLTTSPSGPADTISRRDPTPSSDFSFELVDDMTAYKKVSHAFRSKGRTRMLDPPRTTVIPSSTSTVGNDERKPAARAAMDFPPISQFFMPSHLVAGVAHAQNQQRQQQQTHWPTTQNVLEQQRLQPPQAGIAQRPNIGLPLASFPGGANQIHNVLAPLMTSNQYTSPQLLAQILAMAQAQQLVALNPGLSGLLAPTNLSGGTILSNPPLDQNMLLALLVLTQQQSQQQQLVQQQLLPVNSLFSLTAPSLSSSRNILPQHGMSIAMNQQLIQLLQANMLSPGSFADVAAAADNISCENGASEQPQGNQENNNNNNSSSSSNSCVSSQS
jgi:hypothetical protein